MIYSVTKVWGPQRTKQQRHWDFKCNLLEHRIWTWCPSKWLMTLDPRGSYNTFSWYKLPAAAAAAKSLQSCLTLCNPIDGSPPGSLVPGILQARTLEWVAISFSNAWKWKVEVKSLSRVQLLASRAQFNSWFHKFLSLDLIFLISKMKICDRERVDSKICEYMVQYLWAII